VARGTVPGHGGGGGTIIVYPNYYPWGFWGGGYGLGLGLGYGFYDPFAWGGYGSYDPYGGYYGGAGYGGGYGGYGGGYGGGGGYGVSQSYRDQGSLRLKIDPKQAKVYIDGAFVGQVDSFDGAFQKLSLDAGSHKVELKADGFETTEFDVMITPGETSTFKGDLKRIK
jgi:PEGA domain-containing protein